MCGAPISPSAKQLSWSDLHVDTSIVCSVLDKGTLELNNDYTMASTAKQNQIQAQHRHSTLERKVGCKKPWSLFLKQKFQA